MRYSKPAVLDLAATAQTARGMEYACFSGVDPGIMWYCVSGTGPATVGNTCNVGPAPTGVGNEMCYPGLSATSFCESGASGNSSGTCTAGPSNV